MSVSLNPIYNPVNQVGLLSLDFGSIISPDGRDHPLTALTPISSARFADFSPVLTNASDNPAADPTSGGTGNPAAPATPVPGGSTVDGWLNKIFGTTPDNPWGLPGGTTIGSQGILASAFIRVGLAILALVLLVVVAVRVTGIQPIIP